MDVKLRAKARLDAKSKANEGNEDNQDNEVVFGHPFGDGIVRLLRCNFCILCNFCLLLHCGTLGVVTEYVTRSLIGINFVRQV